MRVLERRKHASSVLCEYSCIPLTEFRALGRPWYLTNPVLRQSGTTAFIHSSFLVIFCLLWFDKNSRLSLYSNSNVEPFLVIFLYLVFFARQWSLEKFAILSLRPRSHARILNTERGLFFFFYLPQNWKVVFQLPVNWSSRDSKPSCKSEKDGPRRRVQSFRDGHFLRWERKEIATLCTSQWSPTVF